MINWWIVNSLQNKMIYKKVGPQIIKAIKNSKNILLICHENPDGDTLGATLALANFLAKEKIKHLIFCVNKPADYFSYMPKIDGLASQKPDLNQFDLIMAIDCGVLARTGIGSEILNLPDRKNLINIDHHQSNDFFGHLNLVIPEASSTSEIIYNLFRNCGVEIDKYMATNLLTGILTDTMNFTNALTSESCLKIASALLKFGARISQITNYLTLNKDLNALKLWGEILSRLTYVDNYNFAYTYINQDDFVKNEVNSDKIDGLAGFLTILQDVDFILVLTEEKDGTIKGNLRTTKDNIDVAKTAQIFNGGGHKKAAGFKVPKNSLADSSDWKNLIINDIIKKLTN